LISGFGLSPARHEITASLRHGFVFAADSCVYCRLALGVFVSRTRPCHRCFCSLDFGAK
jgi:hypothetical protein